MKLIYFLCVFLISTVIRCSDEKVAPTYEKAPVNAVVMPEHAAVNQSVTVEVSFTLFNGCGKFKSFEVSQAGNTFDVIVLAKYEGEACTEALVEAKENYSFKPTAAGTYTFRFWQGNEEPLLVRTLIVQ